MVPPVHGGGLGAAGIRTRVWLGQAEGADLLAPGQGNQILALLLLRPVGEDRPGAQGHVGGQDDARACVHPGQFFHGDGVAEHVQSRAPVFRRVGNAHQAHLPQLLDRLVRELVALVQGKCDGLDLALRKRAELGAQRLVVLCGLEQHLGNLLLQCIRHAYIR